MNVYQLVISLELCYFLILWNLRSKSDQNYPDKWGNFDQPINATPINIRRSLFIVIMPQATSMIITGYLIQQQRPLPNANQTNSELSTSVNKQYVQNDIVI